MKKIKIKTEYIKLDQFLKFTGIAVNGGEAKFIILEKRIYVNGELELRRGKKLRKSDTVEFMEKKFIID